MNTSDRHHRFSSGISTAEDVRHFIGKAENALSPEIVSLMEMLGFDIVSVARLSILGTHCEKLREARGWDLKRASQEAGLPQYRIRAIESAHAEATSQKEIRLYVKLLDAEQWFDSWRTLNEEVFDKLSPSPVSPRRGRKHSEERGYQHGD